MGTMPCGFGGAPRHQALGTDLSARELVRGLAVGHEAKYTISVFFSSFYPCFMMILGLDFFISGF